MTMDRDPAVAAISSQQMWIDWAAGTPRRHAPDFFARFRDGTAAVVDQPGAESFGDGQAADAAGCPDNEH